MYRYFFHGVCMYVFSLLAGTHILEVCTGITWFACVLNINLTIRYLEEKLKRLSQGSE
jgi:hypothetical protein